MPIPVNKSTDTIQQQQQEQDITIHSVFIKVIEIILSSRVVNQDCLLRHEKCCFSSSIITEKDDNCCIIINILQKESNYLLERWMMSFDIMNEQEEEKVDKIEFIQNITNFIQQMPSKIDLIEMYSIGFLNNNNNQCYTHYSTQERIEFRFNSKLKAKRFHLSNLLSLEVVFDENIDQLSKKPIISLQSLSSPSFISWNKMHQIQEQNKEEEEEVHPLASSPTHMTNNITNHNQITIPMIAVRRLSRLSLSAIQLEDEEEEDTTTTTIPIPSSRMQYTNHRTTLAYSTSPNNISFSPNNLFERRNSITELNHHGCLVGSFEESLLSGRMSSMPSKPITFHCQIGVLGYGNCKPSLKCPSHWNIIFPATFYKLGEEETPYVGTIDLVEYSNNLNQPGYRIPPKGQLQFVIKNPNKTAVKLFLIPYDFNDMPKNTKTFLRQKSYTMNTPQQLLRFAIHIQFFRNEKKRIYLYKCIRIVFSNRKFDSFEKFNVICEGPKEPVYMSLF